MIKRNFIFLSLIILLLDAMPGYAADQRACNAITKGCVSNVTNPLTVKDEELLKACQDCCGISQVHVPNSVKGAFSGCTLRCKKSCATAYKKAVAKANKGH